MNIKISELFRTCENIYDDYVSLFMSHPRGENCHTINGIYFDKRVREIKEYVLNSKNMTN